MEAQSKAEQQWLQDYHVNLVTSSAFRCIDKITTSQDWEAVTIDCISENLHNLLTLGQALSAFHRYDLETGAGSLAELIGTSLAESDHPGWTACVQFLQTQRNGDSFGYWPEERIAHKKMVDNEANFEGDLLAPMSATCESVLERIDRTQDIDINQ